jgi:molecular chaperone Hsp33
LKPEALLFRLFHEDGVRVYETHALAARCRCSHDRVETMLRALAPQDLEEMTVEGKVLVTCEFCSTVYTFDEQAVEALVER